MADKTTPIVYLRSLSVKDLDNVMAWVNDPEVRKNFSNHNKIWKKEEEALFLEKLVTSPNDKVFSIENENHAYVGQIGIHQIYWPAKHGRLGLSIKKEFWDKGYAQKANEELIKRAFEEQYGINLNKLWVIFFERNTRMRHICEKLGFVQEGILREEYEHDGKLHNMVRMSLLKSDYEKRKENK